MKKINLVFIIVLGVFTIILSAVISIFLMPSVKMAESLQSLANFSVMFTVGLAAIMIAFPPEKSKKVEMLIDVVLVLMFSAFAFMLGFLKQGIFLQINIEIIQQVYFVINSIGLIFITIHFVRILLVDIQDN